MKLGVDDWINKSSRTNCNLKSWQIDFNIASFCVLQVVEPVEVVPEPVPVVEVVQKKAQVQQQQQQPKKEGKKKQKSNNAKDELLQPKTSLEDLIHLVSDLFSFTLQQKYFVRVFFSFLSEKIFSYCEWPKVTNSKRKNFSTPKKEKKNWTDYFFKFYNEENVHYYLENTGKI